MRASNHAYGRFDCKWDRSGAGSVAGPRIGRTRA